MLKIVKKAMDKRRRSREEDRERAAREEAQARADDDVPIQYPQVTNSVLYSVFELLDSNTCHRMSGTCRQWRHALEEQPPSHLRQLQMSAKSKFQVCGALSTRRYRMLTKLELGSARTNCEVDGDAMELVAKLQYLRSFAVRRSTHLFDGDILHNLPALANLEELEIVHCHNLTGGGVMPSIAKLTKLTKLTLTIHAHQSDWIPLIDAIGANLVYLDVPKNGESIKNNAALAIARNCTQLRYLSLREDCDITDRGFAAIAESCRQLEELNLADTGVTCADVSLFAESLGGTLRTLDLSRCAVGLNGMMMVARHCTSLRSLNIACNSELTDAHLEALAQHCHLIERLNLTKCRSITDHGVAQLVALDSLASLNLYGLEELTEESYARLNSHPNVDKLRANCVMPLHLLHVSAANLQAV